jgi:hypothetical protein
MSVKVVNSRENGAKHISHCNCGVLVRDDLIYYLRFMNINCCDRYQKDQEYCSLFK